MRKVLLALVWLAGCPAPVSRPPPAPAVPVLVEAAELQRRRFFTVRGSAADDLVVRLYVDSACAGPVSLQTTGAGLVQGVTVELVAGADNVFTADAVSKRGVSSGCSAPLRVSYLPSVPPGRPSLDSRPPSPSLQQHFQLVGAADLGTRVQLHAQGCDTPVLAELSATGFFDPGFPVDVPANGVMTFSVAAVNEDSASACVGITVSNDREPPSTATVRLGSPSPSPQQEAWVLVSGDATGLELRSGADCSGDFLYGCRGCSGILAITFPPDASTPFSLLASDRLGNARCVPADQPWVHDPSLPEAQAPVLIPAPNDARFVRSPRIQVAVGRTRVHVFPSDDCSGLTVLETDPWDLVSNGVYVNFPEDGGYVTARSFRADGGWDPCSNAVFVVP